MRLSMECMGWRGRNRLAHLLFGLWHLAVGFFSTVISIPLSAGEKPHDGLQEICYEGILLTQLKYSNIRSGNLDEFSLFAALRLQ